VNKRSLSFRYDIVPPTENNIWVHRRGGHGKTYSARAKNYRKTLIAWAAKELFVDVQKFVRGHTDESIYDVTFLFYFNKWDLVNKGWFKFWTKDSKPRDTNLPTHDEKGKKINRAPPHKAGQRKAKTLYKRIDVGNRRKLLEDTIAMILGVDDSLTFNLELIKAVGPPGVFIRLTETSPTMYGIDLEELELEAS